MSEIARIIWDLLMPSLLSTDKSHSIPVPLSVTFIIGTLALNINCKPVTCPLPAIHKSLALYF